MQLLKAKDLYDYYCLDSNGDKYYFSDIILAEFYARRHCSAIFLSKNNEIMCDFSFNHKFEKSVKRTFAADCPL